MPKIKQLICDGWWLLPLIAVLASPFVQCSAVLYGRHLAIARNFAQALAPIITVLAIVYRRRTQAASTCNG